MTTESSWKVLRTFPPLVLCVVQLFWITTQQTNSRAYKYTIINKRDDFDDSIHDHSSSQSHQHDHCLVEKTEEKEDDDDGFSGDDEFAF